MDWSEVDRSDDRYQADRADLEEDSEDEGEAEVVEGVHSAGAGDPAGLDDEPRPAELGWAGRVVVKGEHSEVAGGVDRDAAAAAYLEAGSDVVVAADRMQDGSSHGGTCPAAG